MVLTIVPTVFLAITFFTGLFGMAPLHPELTVSLGQERALGLMVTLVGVMLVGCPRRS